MTNFLPVTIQFILFQCCADVYRLATATVKFHQ